MKPYTNEFEKENPDITVDFSYTPPPTEYVQTLQTRLVGNQAPDVFILASENKAKLMENGYAMELTNEPFMKNIAQANKDFASKDGKVYGLSTTSWEAGMVYNKDLLAKVGAKSVPTTYDEFIALCKKLKSAGITPYLESLGSERSKFIDGFTGGLYKKNNIGFTTLASKKIDYSKEPTEAVRAWSRLYKENILTSNAVGTSSDDVKSQFMNGQLAMFSTGAWDFKDLQTTKLNWDFGFMPALSSDAKQQYSAGSPSPGYAIYSKLSGDKLKAAKKF